MSDEILPVEQLMPGDDRYLRLWGGELLRVQVLGISHDQDPAWSFQLEPNTGLRQDPATGTVYWRRKGVDLYNMDEGGGGSLTATPPLDLTADVLSLAGLSTVGSSGDMIRSTGAAWQYRTASQVLSDISAQPLDATLTALAGLATGADKLAYSTGTDTFAQADLTAFGRSLLDDADAASARTTLGLVIGTDVQAYDAELAALAGLTSAADKGIQFTGSGTAATYDLTTAGKALLDDADATAQRTTLGAASGIWGVAVGGTGANLSATGGTSQFLRQSSAGAAITVSAIAHADLGSGGGSGTKYLRDDMSWQTLTSDHGALTGLSDDDHTQYALLAGRSGGQTLIGGTASGNNLTLKSSSHATKGKVIFGAAGTTAYDEANERFGIGTASPSVALHVQALTQPSFRLGTSTIYATQTFSESGFPNVLRFLDAATGKGICLGLRADSTYGDLTAADAFVTAAELTNTQGTWLLSRYSAPYPVGIGYWDTTAIAVRSAVEVTTVGSGFGALKLMKAGGTVGIGCGSSAAARALEVRSTSAQIRASYDPSNYAEIAVGSTGNLSITGSGSAAFGVNIGPGSTAAGASCTVLGAGASAAGNESVSIGRNSACAAASCVAIGNTAAPGANNNSIAIGYAAVCTGSPGIALGRAASAGANEFVVGSGTYPSNNWYGGKGATNATPTAWTLNGTGGSGTNIAGAALNLAGGKGTGNAVGGSVKIQTSTAGASGTTLQSLATVIECGPATIGFYGVTPVARAAAYTQTYSTATRTNPAVLTDSTTGTPGTTLVDVTAAHDQAKLNDNFASLNARLNTAMQLINALIDDSQAIGIAQ